ncbi:DUF3311 domain-containing protein [Allosphingosinicella indica]|uniref:DUF3311 domain-containing protein n=1 Tax=Allosphingosinicella indica TaxID=941907 RepID=A0A1X7G0K8_9SPHN|nr:DUF3311 domain-containing protein [Allosphingosinicella indica]SMF61900.1 Protein of unknown function [Allosphingosinicella indica]
MSEDARPRSLMHRWLLVIPFLWQVGMVPFVNDVAWRPFSLPFPMVWQMAGIIVTSIVIAIVFLIDKKQEPADRDEAAGTAGDLH